MVQQRIHRHVGRAKPQVHLLPNEGHLCPKHPLCHLPNQVTIMELKVSISKVCHPDMGIDILHFPTVIFQYWCICLGTQWWSRGYSWFADWQRIIHWLVQYLLCSAGAHCHFADKSSGWSKRDGEDQHWFTDTAFLSKLLSKVCRYFEVYSKGYIYMCY